MKLVTSTILDSFITQSPPPTSTHVDLWPVFSGRPFTRCAVVPSCVCCPRQVYHPYFRAPDDGQWCIILDQVEVGGNYLRWTKKTAGGHPHALTTAVLPARARATRASLAQAVYRPRTHATVEVHHFFCEAENRLRNSIRRSHGLHM